MGYYDVEEYVDEYIRSCGDHCQTIVDLVKKYSDPVSEILELGIGPGKELEALSSAGLHITGTDNSSIFVELARKKQLSGSIFRLDARKMNIDGKFDLIYSNKVLYHLERKELNMSLELQVEKLTKSGYLIHTFWKGSGNDTYLDLHFEYYSKRDLEKIFTRYCRIIEIGNYSEEKPSDSIYIVAQKY